MSKEIEKLTQMAQQAIAQGKNDLAKADFQKLLELDPNHANADEAREFLKSM